MKNEKLRKVFGSSFGQRGLILAAIFIVMAIFEPKFFTGKNWASILLAIAIYGTMACGMLFTILVGGIDFSVASMAACAGSYLAFNWVGSGYTTAGFIKGVCLGLLAGVIVGVLHGVLTTYFGLPAFVITLATKYLIYGYTILYTKGSFVYPARQEVDPYYFIGNYRFLGLTMPVWIFIIIIAITGFVLSKTTFGRRLYAVGGSIRASEYVGINTKRHIIVTYIISALCSSIGGMVLVSLNMQAGSTTANAYEGSVLMAMVVGGINLAGGEGGIIDAVFGALLVGILNNMMILLGVPSDYIKAIQGVIIIVAVAMNVYTARKSAGIISPKKAKKLAEEAAKKREQEAKA